MWVKEGETPQVSSRLGKAQTMFIVNNSTFAYLRNVNLYKRANASYVILLWAGRLSQSVWII